MGIPNSAVNGLAEMELDRDSRRGECIGQILKYWYQIMCLDWHDFNFTRECFLWIMTYNFVML
jgi:hypothetical protein